MLQKLIIEIESDMPLNKYGDNHMIVYDSTKGHYYVTTRESFLLAQDTKIRELEKKVSNQFSQNEELKKSNEEFKQDILKKFNNFIEKYKETNNEIINMIKVLVKE